MFNLVPGAFAAGGRVATLVPPRVVSTTASRTASGSVAVGGHQARVARASRILVEGIHDALLVERVWGDDLRVEGVVVERLDGIDHLAAEIAAFGPAPGRRVGVLVDHLVPGTKESRLAEEVAHPHVLVTGTPFVDVWQAVRPAVVGLTHWPTVPKGQDWKTGICRALGEPDPATCWRRIFGSVHSYVDLEPALVGAVERLIDFVTEPLSAAPLDPLRGSRLRGSGLSSTPTSRTGETWAPASSDEVRDPVEIRVAQFGRAGGDRTHDPGIMSPLL